MTEYIEKTAAATIPVMPKEHRKYQTLNLDDAYENGWYDALECVEKIPPADVRPVVRGEWIDDGCITRCKYCGEEKEFPHWRFCPNCGAYLRR